MKKNRDLSRWRLYLIIICACARAATLQAQTSADVQRQCMEWLAAFTSYAQSIFVDDGVNERGDSIGHFREKGDDVAMVVAFVHEYGQEAGAELPQGMSYDQLRRMAIKALRGEISQKRASTVWNLALTEEFLNFNLEKYDEQETAQRVESIITEKAGSLMASDYACAWNMMPMNAQAAQWQQKMNERARQSGLNSIYWKDQVRSIVALCLLGSKKPDAAMRQPFTGRWRNMWQQEFLPVVMPNGETALSVADFDDLPVYAAMATLGQDADALMLEQRLIDRLTSMKPTTAAAKHQKHHAKDEHAKDFAAWASLLTTTWLLHDFYGDWGAPASTWASFMNKSQGVRLMNNQRAIRSLSKERFAYLTWSNLKEAPTIALGKEEPATQWVAYQTGKTPYCIWATPGNALIAVGDVDDVNFFSMAVDEKPGTQTMELDPRIIGKQKKKNKMKRLEAHVYFAGISEERAKRLVATTFDMSRDGWTIILCDDTDGRRYLLAFNGSGTQTPFQMPKELRKEEDGITKMIIQ